MCIRDRYWNYGEGAEHDKWHKMKTLAELTATSRPGQDKRTLKDSEAPKYLSFHWYPVQYGVGDEEILYDKYEDDYTSTLASPKARARIKGAYELPYFIEPNPMNLEFTKERIEFFIGMPGSGAAVHTDGVCEAIFSVQLSGVKRWRLSPLPPYTRAVQARAPDMQSGAWDPSFVFDLHPGEAVFFPPSLMHETKTVGDECSLSASLQIRYPFPVGHIRDFKTRLIHSQEVSFCFEHWAPFITGHKDGVREMYRQIIKGQDPNNVVQSFFNQIDTNRDGLASMPEKIRHFKWVIKQHRGQVEFTAAEEAKDWFAFNDVNKDGKVTFEEYKELQLDIQTTYATAIEQGACDEMGCHPNVKRDILAGKLNGIESAYIANHESGHDDEVELDEEYDPNKTVGHDEV
eukprot:TRINITY_DN18125_c0_g1_i1.p1 TRINITY_DN18125_c0_g1~~TRINITY_DN18125_c0_g1_i1.p1  ORF type:complete len:403 (+),score=67.52 TRINITY_DN18125_c0_g1_i1:161-1369(+)